MNKEKINEDIKIITKLKKFIVTDKKETAEQAVDRYKDESLSEIFEEEKNESN